MSRRVGRDEVTTSLAAVLDADRLGEVATVPAS